MKIFLHAGRNSRNVSRVSSKIWKIECSGRTVQTWWGPCDVVRRVLRPVGALSTCIRKFKSVAAAEAFAAKRIQSKVAKGYERRCRGRMR
jgi:predicted DNA-binding WGR domain protein